MIWGKIEILYEDDNDKYTFRITDNEKEKDLDREPNILLDTDPLVDNVLQALSKNEKAFCVNDNKCRIISVENEEEIHSQSKYFENLLFDFHYDKLSSNTHTYPQARYKCLNSEKIINFIHSDNPPLVYVYKRAGVCMRCKRHDREYELETVMAKVKSINCDFCKIHITHCLNCDTYFTNEHELSLYEKEYGTLLFEREFEKGSTFLYGGTFRSDSILSRYGYKADGSQTSSQRHRIIDYIISRDDENVYRILDHLNMLIDTRPNLHNAQDIWNEDYHYVRRKRQCAYQIDEAILTRK